MAKAKTDATWINIDLNTLGEQELAAYNAYKASYQAMKAARTQFEEGLEASAKLVTGTRMIFGYNFGKLSVAVVEDDRKAPKAKATTQSLSQFLAQAKSNGDRT